MRIACPNCSAEYDVPDTLLAAGPRLLRCARCAHQFQAQASGATSPAPAEAAVPAGAEAPPPPVPPPPVPPLPEQPPAPPAESPPPPEAAPPVAAAAPAEPAEPEPAPAPAERPRREPRIPDPPLPYRAHAEPAPRGGAPLVLAWLLSLAILGAAGWATWHFHAEIVEAWPPAARLYQALGVR